MNTHDFTIRTADRTTEELRDHAGKLMVIADVASNGGWFTAPYEGLEALHRELGGKGLHVLAFPATSSANKSRARMPRSSSSVAPSTPSRSRCSAKSTSTVRDADPLYTYLRAQAPGNFEPGDGTLY
jgi:glutathione peroxidase